ncbi:TPA: hypothetical protein ACH3X3_004930 [Trebouxia sp. C0006]
MRVLKRCLYLWGIYIVKCWAYQHHLYTTSALSTERSQLNCTPEVWPAGSWTGSNSTGQQRPGQQLYSSAIAQHYIFKHQRPIDCQSQRFMLYASDSKDSHGIGSTLHLATWALAEALEQERILLFLPTPAGLWTQGSFCSNYSNLHDCYFEPISSCNFEDVLTDTILAEVPFWDQTADQKHLQFVRSSLEGLNAAATADTGGRHTLVPAGALALLGKDVIPSQKIYFWWRAQAIAFIVRPNARTLQEIQRRKQQQSWSGVPDGTISVHIRHGDKGKEMKLVPDVEYLRKAEELVQSDRSLHNSIFLSSEDDESIKFFKKLENWTVLSTDVPRPHGGAISPIAFAHQIGSDEEMLNSLVNLDLALECSGWVGTIRSNWNRLIEELRSTVRCKAHQPYIDAHSGWSVTEYDW